MSRKTLLTEAEVRQFLKLANIGPVGDAKVEEMYHAKRDDEEMDEGGMRPGMRDEPPGMRDDEDEDPPGMRDMREEDDEMDAMDMGDAADDMEDAADDMADDAMDMGDAPAAGKMVAVEDFMGALERALEDVLGDEVEVDMDDEGAADDMEDAADDMADDAMDMGGDDEEPMMEADDEDESLDEDAIVNEVARRVAARLQEKNQKENMVEELAEKILKRITSK